MNSLSTYVRRGQDRWRVSTINRESSVPDHPGKYSETIVWKLRPGSFLKGERIFQGEDTNESAGLHNWAVTKLYDGEPLA